MYESAGGGLRYDTAAMTESACALRSAGTSLDGSGTSMPACGNYGDASALISMVLGAFGDAGARLSAEASVLAETVEVCSSGMQEADAQVAVDVLMNGVKP